MQTSARWAALAVAGVAIVALAGCSGSSSSSGAGNSAAGQPNIPVSTVPPTSSPNFSGGTPGKLTGNFCTDIRSIGNDMQVPSNAEGNLSNLETNGVKYLNKVEKEFAGLAGEAPPQVATELRTIATDYQSIASAISSKNLTSLQKIEKQMEALTSKGSAGNAFRSLISYMVTKCP
jgi:hypothetical protein